MLNRSSLVVLLAGSVLLGACGGSPTSPSPSPTPTPTTVTINIVDGLSMQPVSGGRVLHDGRTIELQNGSAELQNVRVGDRLTVSGVPEYRDRNTLYCGSAKVLMWPNKPGDVDEAISRMAYMDDGQMARPPALYLLPSEDFRNTPGAMTILQEAVNRVSAAIEGKTAISIVDSDRGRGTYRVIADPTRGGGETYFGSVVNGVIFGDKIILGTNAVNSPLRVEVVMHELTHALGVAGHNPYPGIMKGAIGFSTYTEAERKVLLLRYTRPVGSSFQGDNDQAAGCR